MAKLKHDFWKTHRGFVAAVLCGVLSCAGAAAQPAWTGPDPERRPRLIGRADLDFTLSELCFPLLLRNAEIATLVDRPGVARTRNRPAWAQGQTFFVGQTDLVIDLRADEHESECTIRLNDGNPARYRETLDARMAQWPAPLTPSGYQFPPNDHARREAFCGPPEGPHDRLLVSTGGRRGADTPAMMITLSRHSTRSPRCDGVPPTDAPAVNPPATDPASAELRAFALTSLCRRALVYPETLETALARLDAIPSDGARDGERLWLIPGAGGIGVGVIGANDCTIYVSDADPGVLRQTVTEQIENAPGLTRGRAAGMENENTPIVDMWCVRDEHGHFALVVSTAARRRDDALDGVIRFARVEADNPRCPR